jgi:hypothetical protein
MDVTRDSDGSEVLIWASAGDPQPVCGNASGIVKVRLANAQQTCLFTIDWGVGVHISAPDGNGWFFMETYDPSDPQSPGEWTPYLNEVLQIRLDGSQVRRLLHHRSRPFDSYWYTPRTSVSRDGRRLIYSSNYGLQQILNYPATYADSYLVTVSGGGPTPTPTPTSQPQSWTRVEQDGGSVSYTGTWYPNALAVHSGGSATLSMETGATARFAFNGTRARWIGYRDQWAGIAKVYVDGTLVGTVDTYAASAQAQALLFTSAPLPAGPHNLSVVVQGAHGAGSAGDWVWVDAFDYLH